MRIRWMGAKVVRRSVGRYEWSRETGFVQEVEEAGLVAELLTAPEGKFVVDEGDPLARMVGIRWAAGLVLEGVCCLGELAELSGAGVERVAKGLDVSKRTVGGWVRGARGVRRKT